MRNDNGKKEPLRRFLAALLALVMICALLVPGGAAADDDADPDGIEALYTDAAEVLDEADKADEADEAGEEPLARAEDGASSSEEMEESEPAEIEEALSEEPGEIEPASPEAAPEDATEDADAEPEVPGKNVTNVAPFLAPVVGQLSIDDLGAKRKALSTNAAKEADSGVVLNKEAVYNEKTGKTTITMEAYATGEKIVKEVTDSTPTDIVLVLDLSSSMTDSMRTGGYSKVSNTFQAHTYYSSYRTALFGKVKDSDEYVRITVSRGSTSTSDHTFTYTIDGVTKSNVVSYTAKPWSTGTNHLSTYFDGLYTYETTTRLAAMKAAVKSFTDAVIAKSETSDHRLAIVTFSTSATYKTGTDATDSLLHMNLPKSVETVDGIKYTASGSTHTNLGLKYAVDLFKENPIPSGETRNRVVVLFTDGTPGSKVNQWNSESTTIAEEAVAQSELLKNTYGATVYAVGIFEGADASSPGTPYTSTTSTGSSAAAVAPYGNYFMHQVASKNGDGYYLSATDSTALATIFNEAAHQIEVGGSTVTLTDTTVIKDIVTPYFEMPENAGEVTLKTADYIGDHTWGAPVNADGVTATIDGRTLNVTGFDFSANWCGTVTTDSGVSYRGKKLIIEFAVTPGEDFLGGTVETNDPASGIYVGDESFGEFPVPEPVELPVKTLEVQNLGDHHIYATHGSKILTHLDGLEYAELIDGVEHTSQFNSIFNGVNNVAADVTYNVIDLYGSVVASFTVPRGTVLETGKLAESGIHWMQDGQAVDYPILDGKGYKVEVVVNGNLTGESDEDLIQVYDTKGTIYVSVPKITYQDQDAYYLSTIPTDGAMALKFEWVCEREAGELMPYDTDELPPEVDNVLKLYDSDGNLLTTVTGTAKPEPDGNGGYTMTVTHDIQNVLVDSTGDIVVRLDKIWVPDTSGKPIDIADRSHYERSCPHNSDLSETEKHLSGVDAVLFKIHVYKPELNFRDLTAYYGGSVDLSTNPVSTGWKWILDSNPDVVKKDTDVHMLTQAPSLTYTLTPDSGKVQNGYVTTSGDFPVYLRTLTVADTDITAPAAPTRCFAAVTRTAPIRTRTIRSTWFM